MIKEIVMYAMSIASRGIKNKTVDLQTKQLRALSCFGHGKISPCPYLEKSKRNGQHYCGKCGCGDKDTTALIKESKEYSKLDYPVLNCPAKMPGFTNYDPNFVDDKIKNRKESIQNFDINNLKYIQVTINSNEENEKLIDELNKMLENS
jgi:hypothetical protein